MKALRLDVRLDLNQRFYRITPALTESLLCCRDISYVEHFSLISPKTKFILCAAAAELRRDSKHGFD